MRPADDGEHHHDLVVAHQPVDMVDTMGLLALRPLLQHADTVRSAIDHVAEIDQAASTGGLAGKSRNGRQQRLEFGRAAVHVADGEHGLSLQVEGRGLPFGNFDGQGAHGGRG